MNDIINWKQYVNYIFCLNYLQNNRLDKISKTLTNIGINVNDSSFFSFIYDYEHCIFKEQYENMKIASFDFFNKNRYYPKSILDVNNHNYIFYLGLNTYRTLKIAQYFNYDKIIIFEDDIIFLKDINYITKVLDFIFTQDFDLCMCQTTFIDSYSGEYKYLIQYDDYYIENLGNDMVLKTKMPIGIFGGGFMILTKNGINKIVNYYEKNNILVCLDALDALRNKIELQTLFTLKPLCIQEHMKTSWTEERRKEENINIIISEYN